MMHLAALAFDAGPFARHVITGLFVDLVSFYRHIQPIADWDDHRG